MLHPAPQGGPGLGLDFQAFDRKVIARAAITKGDVVMFDLANADGAVSNNDLLDSASGLVNVTLPVTAYLMSGIFAIALEDIADNAQGKVRLCGIVEVANVASATVAGSVLCAANGSGQLIIPGGTTAHDSKILGRALTADTSNLAPILFDGMAGFGVADAA